MSLLAIILVLVSAAMHAGWNVFTKSKDPSTSFFLLATLAGVVVLSPFLLAYHRALAVIPGRVWFLLLGSGFFLALYYVSLAAAYRAGNMSVAYPLARSSPILVVSAVAFLLGRGDQLSVRCVLGILLVVAGCFLLPMQRFGEFRLAHYWNTTCGCALLAAVGTAGYSILDDEALRLLRGNPALGLGTTPTTLLYACLETVSGALWLALAVAVGRDERAGLLRETRAKWKHAAVAGVTIWAGYVLILVSLAFVRNVSYVAAFRQLSIPLGAALGVVVLKEPAYAPKTTGVWVIVVGLLLVATG